MLLADRDNAVQGKRADSLAEAALLPFNAMRESSLALKYANRVEMDDGGSSETPFR
jgi:hypothetical protein